LFAGAPRVAGRKSRPNSHKSAVRTSSDSRANISLCTERNPSNVHLFESYAPFLRVCEIWDGSVDQAKRYWIANLEEKHTLSRVREPGGRLRDKNPRHRGGRGDDRWMCLDRTDKVQCGALMGAIRGAAVWTNQRAALGSPRLRVVATI
jgi:hypothetical protein